MVRGQARPPGTWRPLAGTTALLAWSGAVLLTMPPVLPAFTGSAAGASQGLSAQPRHRAVRELAAGKLLVAARNLPDPNFAETVVLLADFSPQGAMGLILNRPTDVPLAEMLPHLEDTRGRRLTIFFGGPVPERGALGLLRSPTARKDTRHLVKDVHLVNTRAAFDELIASGAGQDRFRVYVGYAGWGGGQLERETAEGSWHVVDGDGDAVFDPDVGSMWPRHIRRVEGRSARTRQPAPAMTFLRGSACRAGQAPCFAAGSPLY